MASASPSSTTTTPTPTQSSNPPKAAQQPSPAVDNSKPKNDLDKANALKEDANRLVKEGKQSEACERYFEAINTIRFSDRFKNASEGKAAEMACRLNIALCKQTMGQYE